ncbi:MAG: chorismate synthase [Oscillospiraceae bacterium]|jgi:chorismate synthase|nr:chorismate synthase [Oscillospiraceae bacterium]
MSFSVGERVKLTLFGQSHAPFVGGVLDGLPADEPVDLQLAQAFLNRRSPGKTPLSTARSEPDVPQILAGLLDGKTCGAPLAFAIPNADTRSGDYDKFRAQPRPSHADFPALLKYGDAHDIRGGGFFSARLTAPLCFAGAIALQILARRGVIIAAHIARIAGINDTPFDAVNLTEQTLKAPSRREFPVNDPAKGTAMQEAILAAKADGDSVGGVIECAASGLSAGLGEPLFDSLEGTIARLVFAIPAVKGIEFGAGFAISDMRGSKANDPYIAPEGNALRSSRNNNGGILGGLSTGMPLVFRAAFKPTPSIAKAQETWNTVSAQTEALVIPGRHDPCVVPRAVPCVEAAAALALLMVCA